MTICWPISKAGDVVETSLLKRVYVVGSLYLRPKSGPKGHDMFRQ